MERGPDLSIVRLYPPLWPVQVMHPSFCLARYQRELVHLVLALALAVLCTESAVACAQKAPDMLPMLQLSQTPALSALYTESAKPHEPAMLEVLCRCHAAPKPYQHKCHLRLPDLLWPEGGCIEVALSPTKKGTPQTDPHG